MSENSSIHIGSIIRLESINTHTQSWDTGFLYSLKWLTDIPVISMVPNPYGRALVTTYLDPKLADAQAKTSPHTAESCWQILSADPKKKLGDELKSGDSIYLLNMSADAGYLDTFEWVRNLEPFKDYPMTIGVLTSSIPKRGGGVSATWIVSLAQNNADQAVVGQSISANDTIYLKSAYPGAGFLFAYAPDGKTVSQHEYKHNEKEVFKNPKYKDAKKFVFTGQVDQDGMVASRAWKILSIDVEANLYRIEKQFGSDQESPWHEAGIFQIGNGLRGCVSDLKLSRSATQPDQLTGHVRFEKDSLSYDLSATYNDTTKKYDVRLSPQNQPNQEAQAEEWVLGTHEFQMLIDLELKKDRNGELTGLSQYSGEEPLRLTARQTLNVDDEILYDFFHPDVLRGRSQKMQGVINSTYASLAQTMKSLADIEKALDRTSRDAIDFDFQKMQLDNLQALNKVLNDFYVSKISYLMKQSFKNHRTDQTLAPLYLIRQNFQHLATDYEIIQRAAVQRQWALGMDGAKYFMSEQAIELLIMDKLALASLAPFKDLVDPKPIAIITYLSEETHIRQLPYTDQVILVGVSYDRVPAEGSLFDDKPVIARPFHAFELMAIPHEIGHYVYEHAKLRDGRSFGDLAKQFVGTNLYHRWCEEIFADLYGCIVAGPLTVLSMRALLVSINRERAWKDDELHPTPVLRIFILNEILRILKDIDSANYDFSSLADEVDKDWTEILESWGYAQVKETTSSQTSSRPARIYLHDPSAIHLEQIVNIERVIHAVRPIIIEFATHLLKHVQGSNHVIPWAKKVAPESSVAAMLERCNEIMRAKTDRSFGATNIQGLVKLSLPADRSRPNFSNAANPNNPFLPDELLQQYLLKWGDSGPHGWGGH